MPSQSESKRTWKIDSNRADSSDGAAVRYHQSAESRPWLAGHRGYMAFGPGSGEYGYLGFFRRGGRFRIPRWFKTIEAAIKAVDREFPFCPEHQPCQQTEKEGE